MVRRARTTNSPGLSSLQHAGFSAARKWRPQLASLLLLLSSTTANLQRQPTAFLLDPHNRRLTSVESPEDIRQLLPVLPTLLSQRLEADGIDPSRSAEPGFSAGAQLVAQKRPLRIAFYNRLDSSRGAQEQSYIMDKLLPAAAAVLARSLRVRTPSGLLPLAGILDEEREPIPGPETGIDADVVMKVTSQAAASEECDNVVASAAPILFEAITARPVYGIVRLCKVSEDKFFYDITTVVHEILHALGFIGALFPIYPGYPNGISDMAEEIGQRLMVKTPNVVISVREQFECPQMQGGLFEDDGGDGTASAHWEERIFEGEMLDAGDSGSTTHNNRHQLTDVTLALMQDTNWYDVKYGSAGFNSYGYKAGCEFALGTFNEALSSPSGSRYLCPASTDPVQNCLHDFSGDGYCLTREGWDGFYRIFQVDDYNFDCQGGGAPAGQRCLVQASSSGGASIGCVGMSCSATGQVLVEGSPCDPDSMICPDADLMCGDPGLLTCTDDLNDCSGNGDCRMGACYCHAGWGGDDCSVSVCIKQCNDGSPCPPSGFCSVPECGTWSSGSADRGVPCNTAAGETAGHGEAGAALLPDSGVRPESGEPSTSSTAGGSSGGSTTTPSSSAGRHGAGAAAVLTVAAAAVAVAARR